MIPVETWQGCYDTRWEGLIVPEAFAHPAKFARGLIERLVRHGLAAGWWRAGDTVGDPFGGVALGGIVCGYHGLNWVGVELEEKFVRLGRGHDCPGLSRREWVRWLNRGDRNRAVCPRCQSYAGCAAYHGDGRIPSVPPHRFAGNLDLHRAKFSALGMSSRVTLLGGDSRRFAALVAASASGIITSPPYVDRSREPHALGAGPASRGVGDSAGRVKGDYYYGTSPGQVEQLPTGELGAVLTSPPYVDSVNDRNGIDPAKFAEAGYGPNSQAFNRGYGATPGQIGALRRPGDLDAVLTSPPYARALGNGGASARFDFIQGEKTLPDSSYGDAPGQIERLSVGSVDAVLTSPPYADGGQGGGGDFHPDPERHGDNSNGGSLRHGYGKAPGQIGNCAPGSVDAVITSPLYAETPLTGDRNFAKSRRQAGTTLARDNARERYGGETPGQIGVLKSGELDAVVTSPPWEDQESATNAGKFKDPSAFAEAMSSRDGRDSRNGTTIESRMAQFARATQATYGESEGQIGNVTGETYWQAMAVVYRQCRLALRPGGVMAVVVKDYVKDKERVPLCDQTLRLLEAVGFTPVVRIRAMLVREERHVGLFNGEPIIRRKSRKSFFRRLAEKNGSPAIDWEEVLVVRADAG